MKDKLTDQEKKIIHDGVTEAPFTGEYWDHKENGTYKCNSCGQSLFSSDTKLNSKEGPLGLQGWPAFENALPDAIEYKEDSSMGMKRTEAICSKCKIHLGHVFDEVEGEGTKHYCINSCSIDFDKKDEN
jgi:peptide-methionine (R)-S-oxide reductase